MAYVKGLAGVDFHPATTYASLFKKVADGVRPASKMV
jgi:hypothetical protein